MENVFNIVHHESALFFILRVILGILFLFQGIDKVFKMGIHKVTSTFQAELGTIIIPKWMLFITAVFSSYVEFVGGILLIVGLFKYYTMYLLGVDLILVTIAFSLIQPVWDMKFVWPRLILLAVLLYLPPQWDTLSLDQLLK
jgi:putative oxidoreductase